MTSKIIDTGYRPRPLQALLHTAVKRFNVLVMHRRFGKSIWSVNHKLDKGLRNQRRNPQYAYICPTFGQAKRVIWTPFKEYALKIPGAVANESDLRIDIPRPANDDFVRIMLLGAENPDSIRGIYLDGVTLDEYAQHPPSLWSEIIRPALSDRLGWANFIGTPKGRNHFFEIYEYARVSQDPDWYSCLHRASETGIIDPKELESLRRTMSEDEYDQEYECSFAAALKGAYYGKEMSEAEREGRIREVHWDRSLPVHTFWDLGIGDSTSIVFVQQLGDEVRVIDYIEESGVGLAWYAKALKDKPYTYGEHWLPHDAAAKELGTGKSRQETLYSLGIRNRILPKQAVDDGINAARMLLPRCYFDAKKTERLVRALQNYEREWDDKLQIFKATPLHNWASHGSDAFRYLALGLRREMSDNRRNLPRKAETEYDPFTHAG